MPDVDARARQRDEFARTLDGLEPMVERVVQAALDRVAEQYAASLRASLADLVAQGEPVDDSDARRVAELWIAQLLLVLLALLTVFAAGMVAARRLFTRRAPAPGRPAPPDRPGEPGPPQVDDIDQVDEVPDLVDIYLHRPQDLPATVRDYLTAAENRLRDVGDTLWQAARQALAEGTVAGDDIGQLRDRLQTVFREGGQELGEVRATRIARTETLAAWNWAQLHVARTQPAAVRPLYKTWVSTLDLRTRDAHFRVDGQTVLLDGDFHVGGEFLDFPGDPAASASNVINCRCGMTFGDSDEPNPDEDGRQGLTAQEINDVVTAFEERGIVRDQITAASGGPYTSGMIALVPSQADIDRLAVDGGERADDLHLTLLFLGEADGVDAETRATIVERLTEQVGSLRNEDDVAMPLQADAFAISAFNPRSAERDTAIVLGVGGEHLAAVQRAVASTVGDVYEYPAQHTPWVAHVTLTYDDDLGQVAALADRTGPLVFDRLRVAFGSDVVDIPLAGPATEGDTDMPDQDLSAAAPPPRRWSTPGDTALAFEGEETGDGRIFAPRALYWDGESWPLQFADEMRGGHQGAVLAGEIQQINRVGGRITGGGVLYTNRDAGQAAIDLLDADAPLGVSVDLDDVDMEFVDRRPRQDRAPDADEGVILLASLKQASIMQLPDGGWSVRATQVADWTASDEGVMDAGSLRAALTAAGVVTAAAGDSDDKPGEVLFSEQAGDFVMRITKARLRGATLVAMPAFDKACITLDPADSYAPGLAAAACDDCEQIEVEAADVMDALTASAWHELQALPAMPAAWFAEPTADELPPDSGGVHYRDGRIYGWVAQRGVPHEGMPGRRLTIEQLGDIDFSTFLRAKMNLDDGSTMKVGAFTMNVGHHRDGAECETAACQFDDTRTVAGVVTVGMNERGMWFSGAAAPWLSDWDRLVFASCQPSYHMRQNPNGQWALRAVLTVPVPGHPSRLAASAVISRSNMALTAAAVPQQPAPTLPEIDYGRLAASLAPAVVDEMERRAAARAEIEALSAELDAVRAELAQGMAASVKAG
ncbi:phage minor head protein [Nonomuraea recticatena]|uniref:Phage head morphogenesis domain-containing protein n=1 Tax=Nonomuraea recticatena TaxID=46178 RepID=A0ABN3TBP6_9ACTN